MASKSSNNSGDHEPSDKKNPRHEADLRSHHHHSKSQLSVDGWSHQQCLEWVSNLPEHKDAIRKTFIEHNVDGHRMKELCSASVDEMNKSFPSLKVEECSVLIQQLDKLFKTESASSSQAVEIKLGNEQENNEQLKKIQVCVCI